MSVSLQDGLVSAIKNAVVTAAKEEQERLIVEAVQTFEKRLRTAVGNVAINVSDFFSVQRLGPELVIHVKVEARSDHP
jgi:predicted Zn-dependent protease with MMP-like domain